MPSFGNIRKFLIQVRPNEKARSLLRAGNRAKF
jgi:hypothetical protein